MSESRRHERDVSLRLLSESQEPQDVEQAGWSSSNAQGKFSNWVDFPFRKILCSLLAVIALAALSFAIYGSTVGVNAYRRLAFPHRAVHASAATVKDGSRVVRPYFAPQAKGGIHNGTLLVRIWFGQVADREPLQHNPESHDYWTAVWRREQRMRLLGDIGETGFVELRSFGEAEAKPKWTETFATEIKISDIERTERHVAHIMLPGHIIHSLVTQAESLLVATFELLPDPTTLPVTTYEHHSTRPIPMYGSNQPWPLPYSPPDPVGPAPLSSFFAHSSAGKSLKTRERDFREDRAGAVASWDSRERRERYATFLSTRTWVTMASDYSIYGVDQFTEAQDALEQFKLLCANSTGGSWEMNPEECYRTFGRDGHFENLLVSDGSGTGTQWYYGPFLTTRLSPTSPNDYVELPSEAEIMGMNPSEVPDLSFDWSLTYSSMSAAKLSLAKPNTWSAGLALTMFGGSHHGKALDNDELYKALLGIQIVDGSRPVARALAQYISDGLWLLTIPLVLHYWYTRQVSTGISLIPLATQTLTDLIYYIVTSAVKMEDVYIIVFVIAIACFVAILFKQLYLLIRPDFKLQHLEGRGLTYPVAVRFRLATVAESRSSKLDAKFDWRLRVLITIVTFGLLRFAPVPPVIAEAQKYADIMQGFGGFQHYDPIILTVVHILAAIHSSVWLTSCLSQILLNQQSQSFAGLYAYTAYLQFGSVTLAQVTRVFARWFGKGYLMQSFTVWDIVVFIVRGIVVVHAYTLPSVAQSVEDFSD